MIQVDEIVRLLSVNAEAIRALLETISVEQAQWKPNPETWSMKEVMEHVYNEERGDFRVHLAEMFNDPPQPWGALQEAWISVDSCQQALEKFLAERKASITWLKGQKSVNWDTTSSATFNQNEVIVLSAGDVLTSWVAHDYLHLRQINELLYAWNEKQAAPYSVQYAGGW